MHVLIFFWTIPYAHITGISSGFPESSVDKEPVCNTGDSGSIPGSGRSPEGENGNLLKYSYLENPMDRGAWQTAVHGVEKESDTT